MTTKIFALFLTLISTGKIFAQSPTIGTELSAIGQAYDNAKMMSFEIQMVYSSDTTEKGKFEYSTLNGYYSLNKGAAYYKLDNIEFLQNDSFAITIYNDEKIMLVAKPQARRLKDYLPMGVSVDSFVAAGDTNYIATLIDTALNVNKLVYQSLHPEQSQYQSVEMLYSKRTHLLESVIYRFKEADGEFGIQSLGYENARKAVLEMRFVNYHQEVEMSKRYSADNYLFFKSANKFEPSAKYQGYTLYNSLNQ